MDTLAKLSIEKFKRHKTDTNEYEVWNIIILEQWAGIYFGAMH